VKIMPCVAGIGHSSPPYSYRESFSQGSGVRRGDVSGSQAALDCDLENAARQAAIHRHIFTKHNGYQHRVDPLVKSFLKNGLRDENGLRIMHGVNPYG
jgi:hypothetical protein